LGESNDWYSIYKKY
jgi:P-type Ca2+ transporter type 2C